MTQPCGQEAKIAKIETTLDHVVKLLEKHEDREDSMLTAMNKVASQAEVLHAHTEVLNRHEKSLEEAFKLIREHIEEAIELDRRRDIVYKILEKPKVVYALVGLILLGTVIDVIAHSTVMKKIFEVIKEIVTLWT